jgi:uncharacterized protein
MIIETIFSTIDVTGKPNFAPMGLVWGEEYVTVRPYRSSRTYQNLISTGYGVANMTDDVLAYVRCGLYDAELPGFPAKVAQGIVFQETCSWRELAVVSHGGSPERAEMRCRILHEERQKDFVGFCRAANAVLEAIILATRLRLHNPETVAGKLAEYQEIVQKTGDANEQYAFQLVHDYIRQGG